MTILLTTDDVRALRAATDLCFDHNSAVQSRSQARIRAISGGRGGPRPEQTYEVPVEASRIDNYGAASPTGEWDCFHMVMNAQHTPHIRTLVQSIHAWDRLGFRWVRDNSSPLTNEAGVVVDQLYVEVLGSGKTLPLQTRTFLVHTSISLDNTARMVRVR